MELQALQARLEHRAALAFSFRLSPAVAASETTDASFLEGKMRFYRWWDEWLSCLFSCLGMEHAGIHCGAGLVSSKEGWGCDGRDRFLQPFLGISRAEEPVYTPRISEACVHVQCAPTGSPDLSAVLSLSQRQRPNTGLNPLQSLEHTWALGCSHTGAGIALPVSCSVEKSAKSYLHPALGKFNK